MCPFSKFTKSSTSLQPIAEHPNTVGPGPGYLYFGQKGRLQTKPRSYGSVKLICILSFEKFSFIKCSTIHDFVGPGRRMRGLAVCPSRAYLARAYPHRAYPPRAFPLRAYPAQGLSTLSLPALGLPSQGPPTMGLPTQGLPS